MNGQLVFSLLKENQLIADLGSGPQGGFWWGSVKEGSIIDAFDLFFETANAEKKENLHFFRKDVTKLTEEEHFKEKYDLIIADHILEHVMNAERLAQSIKWISKPGAFVHIGLPMADNFPDIFYRLIHRFDSGGHIQKLTDADVVSLMQKASFTLIKNEIWEEDWVWFEKLFDLKYNKVERVTREEIEYMADVFRKELTSAKGYFYGREYVFERAA